MPDRTVQDLVGRDESLGQLRSALDRARSGAPGVVVVCGETGIGKTRLIREFLDREEPVELAGSCVPVAGEALPFAPLTQALRGLSRTAAGRRQLDRLPDLAPLLPDADRSTGGSDTQVDALQQLRLFQAVLTLLGRLGAERPVAHVVEDLHWADRSTLDLLRFLAANLTDERAVVVLSYRLDLVTEESPLRPWLAELTRLPESSRIVLGRLNPAETAGLACSLAARLGPAVPPPTESELATIIKRSAGNPLFVKHLVRHGAATRLPETLHDLLRTRVAVLPEPTRRVLQVASVLSRAVPVVLLSHIVDRPDEEVEEEIRPAIDQHVARFRRDGLFEFTHPVFRELISDDLMPTRRARLHRMAAEALEAIGEGTGVPGEIARHWHHAGDLAKALESAVAAGRHAERMSAFADAYTNFSRAAELMEQVPHDLDSVDVLACAARSAGLLGDDAEAVRLAQAALALADDITQRAELLARLGRLHFLAGRGPQAESAFREALDLLADGEPDRTTAQVTSWLALMAAVWSRLDEAEEFATAALALCRGLGARREEGHAHEALGIVAASRYDRDRGIEHLRKALEIAREFGDADGCSTSYINLSHVLGLAGRIDEQVEVCREGIQTLTEMGLLHQGGNVLIANVGESLLLAGRLDEAEDYLRQGLALDTRGMMSAPVLMRSGQLAMVRGDLQLAWDRCEQARLIIEAEEPPHAWLRELVQVSAEVELWAERPAAAYDLVCDTLTVMSGTDEEPECGPLVALGLRALGDLAETHRDGRSREDQQQQLHDLLRLVPWEEGRGGPARPTAAEAVDRWVTAELARAAERSEARLWAEAAAAWESLARPFAAGYARWREAEARLARAVDAEAIGSLRRAHDAAQGLAAPRLVEELEKLARWYRIDLIEDIVPRVDDPVAAYGLTPREHEILECLAAGLTNQEIAASLYISVKTASVHVSNILRKLDVSGRQEAARIGHRHGLGRDAGRPD